MNLKEILISIDSLNLINSGMGRRNTLLSEILEEYKEVFKYFLFPFIFFRSLMKRTQNKANSQFPSE